jgi:hypothetical protein
VSFYKGKNTIILSQSRLLSNPSGSANQTIGNYYAEQAWLGHKVVAVPLADVFPPQSIRREAYVWIQLSHDHILSLEGITDNFGPLPALVPTWVENGSLDNYLMRENFQLSDSRKLELVGVQPCHFQFVLSRDSAISDTADGCWS